jgi:hypothetical protein
MVLEPTDLVSSYLLFSWIVCFCSTLCYCWCYYVVVITAFLGLDLARHFTVLIMQVTFKTWNLKAAMLVNVIVTILWCDLWHKEQHLLLIPPSYRPYCHGRCSPNYSALFNQPAGHIMLCPEVIPLDPHLLLIIAPPASHSFQCILLIVYSTRGSRVIIKERVCRAKKIDYDRDARSEWRNRLGLSDSLS